MSRVDKIKSNYRVFELKETLDHPVQTFTQEEARRWVTG